MKGQDRKDDEVASTSTVVGGALSWLVGCLLFVPLWAGLNFAFGTALDGPIGAFVMEQPCQRLAGTTEPLDRYTLGKGKVRMSSSVCHFGSGAIPVDGPTDGLGFTGREFVYLSIGFVGYAVCLAGALVLAFLLGKSTWRLFAFIRDRGGFGRREQASPQPSARLKRSRRRKAPRG